MYASGKAIPTNAPFVIQESRIIEEEKSENDLNDNSPMHRLEENKSSIEDNESISSDDNFFDIHMTNHFKVEPTARFNNDEEIHEDDYKEIDDESE